MNEVNNLPAPKWLMFVSVLFLIWNLFGLAIFFMAIMIFNNRESLEKAGLNEQQIELTLSTPIWVNAAFGVAVVTGVLGCLALVMKKRIAIPLLIVSLLGVLVQNSHLYFFSDGIQVMGVGASPAVIAGAILLVPFAMMCARKGWLK